MEQELLDWLAGGKRADVTVRGAACVLRVVTAWELLEARREAGKLAEDGMERALCSNACLLARALELDGERLFSSGGAVMDALTPGEIEALAARLGRLNRAENPSAEDGEKAAERLKKAFSTRPMSG
jgi:hypothetical protein